MNTTANTTNVQTIPTTPKPQTSREVIQQNVQLLIEQLEQGHSEALTNYLTAMGRFHIIPSATFWRSRGNSLQHKK